MKFIKDKNGEWSAHETPFTFNLFVYPDWITIVWCYAGRTGDKIIPNLQDAFDWCYQFMLTTTLDQLQRIAPPGARTAETDRGYTFVYDGYDKDMGYRCVSQPGHSGQCYSAVKGICFDHQ